MRMLVILGIDAPKDIDTEGIADATSENVYKNTMPPPGEVREGWVFMDADKEPDWSWPDYSIVVGTAETGRHEVTERILSTEDIRTHLINTYDRLSEEQGEE